MTSLSTQCVTGALKDEEQCGAIIAPLYQTSTYIIDDHKPGHGFDYTRSANPTRQQLEEKLADLEGANYGVAFSSGMAAIDACFRLLKSGDHIVCSDDVYGGVTRLALTQLSKIGVEISFVDSTQSDNVRAAIQSNTKLLWVETPSNPLLKISSLAELGCIAREKDIFFGVDSTFATPILLRPVEFGADLIVQSTTKYISGHNQIIGGAVLCNDEGITEELRLIQRTTGAVPSPFDCWLTLNGLKSLALRVERHCENGLAVAQFLDQHPLVSKVYYPGLEKDPGHKIAAREMKAFGGMISLELNLSVQETRDFIHELKLFHFAESLGALESLVTHPASMTHKSVPAEERSARGLTDGLIRLSVGIEDKKDLVEDLECSLEKFNQCCKRAA